MQNTSKSFISEDDEPYIEEPSTETNMRQELSDHEPRIKRSKNKKSNSILEIINSSEEEEQ